MIRQHPISTTPRLAGRLLRTGLLLLVLARAPTAFGADDDPEGPELNASDPQILLAVDRHIRRASPRGVFELKNRKSGETLELKRERLLGATIRRTGPNSWVVCGEFVTRDDHFYDLDLEVAGPGVDQLNVRSIWTHAVDRIETYSWKREGGGYWFRKFPKKPKKKKGLAGLLGIGGGQTR